MDIRQAITRPIQHIVISQMDLDTVHDGDTVIVQMHDGVRHMLKVTRNIHQKVARSRLSVNCLIGATYGDIFEVFDDLDVDIKLELF